MPQPPKRARRWITAGLVAPALTLSACTGSQPDGPAGTALAQAEDARLTARGVTVEAVGTVEGTPDVLTALVGVEVEAADVDTAYTEGNQAAAAVRDALLDAGVDSDDVQTAHLSLGARQPRGPDDTADGYAARTRLRVQLRDLDAAGAVLDDAVSAAGDHATLQSLGFSLDDDSELVVAAREAAFAEAQAKAEQYAELAGRSLGELDGLSEAERPHTPFPEPMEGDVALDRAAEAAPPVEPGQEQIRVRIRATWALQ